VGVYAAARWVGFSELGEIWGGMAMAQMGRNTLATGLVPPWEFFSPLLSSCDAPCPRPFLFERRSSFIFFLKRVKRSVIFIKKREVKSS
jgi:hypothetical protein